MTEAKPLPLSAEEVSAYLKNHDEILAQLRKYDGPEPQVGNMCEVVNAMGRLLALITSLQAENAALVEALRQIDDDPPVIPFDPAYDEGTRNKQWIRYFKEVAKNARFNPTSSGAALLKRLEDAEERVRDLEAARRVEARMPGTVEVCRRWRSNNCADNHSQSGSDYSVCNYADCPLRSQEKK